MFSIELDLPVSINSMYGVNPKTGRRYLKKDAKEWKEYAIWEITRIRNSMSKVGDRFPTENPVLVTRHFIFPDGRRRDHANYYKQIDDALVNGGILRDDSQIKEDHNAQAIDSSIRKGRVIVYVDLL